LFQTKTALTEQIGHTFLYAQNVLASFPIGYGETHSTYCYRAV